MTKEPFSASVFLVVDYNHASSYLLSLSFRPDMTGLFRVASLKRIVWGEYYFLAQTPQSFWIFKKFVAHMDFLLGSLSSCLQLQLLFQLESILTDVLLC